MLPIRRFPSGTSSHLCSLRRGVGRISGGDSPVFGATSTDASGQFGSVCREDSCFPPWCGESWEGGRRWAAVPGGSREETPGIALAVQGCSA